ncbi:uncharacterized protein [Maniola hyperantus]|uniref:uncharacterized protein n=1 Tax=Aphantopus hyperantus TaxID=2795564 RepID=UPI002122F246
MPRISLSVGKFEAEGLYGDRGGKVTLSGRLVIENIRIKGNALLRLDPGPVVTIYNINADSSIANIEADVKATWQCRDCEESDDVSDKLNTFLNETLLQILERFKKEIDTIVAEAIRYLVNYVWQ